jgi:hypothetical protein
MIKFEPISCNDERLYFCLPTSYEGVKYSCRMMVTLNGAEGVGMQYMMKELPPPPIVV